ncbi:hypothetical protein RAS1_34190 [Phycisphaerae bacterium RAS1]|nr:hypothetical protein RAS1_34190 [Phycisphaerae bacterium RAS1]
MARHNFLSAIALVGVLLLETALCSLVPVAAADDFTLDWWTADGGGDMWSAGGAFQLSGTIGQTDAMPAAMSGGAFTLTGGFWAGAGTASGLGDMNCDGSTDILDINPFVLALSDPLTYAAVYPNCDINNGDINGDGEVNVLDINPFVALLAGG